MLKATSRFLTAHLHTVAIAGNGKQSLERLQREFGQLDLLIIDFQVPTIALHYLYLLFSAVLSWLVSSPLQLF